MLPLVIPKIDYTKEILALKKAKGAIILAHYYQRPEIQEVADFVGDSLALSKQAAKTQANMIVFCGVHFMAETAKILNKTKKVLLPDLDAGCSLADSCSPEAFRSMRLKYPKHTVVTYINCSAEIKAQSDIICTSSNAKEIIESISKNQEIIFAPDRNLGQYLIRETGRNLVLWDGACVVHEAFSLKKVLDLCVQHPQAKIVVHPESDASILELANFIGSTSAMINYIKKSDSTEFLIGTEAGILHQLNKEITGKTLIPLPTNEETACACSECSFMKVNTLEKIYHCLLNESPEIKLNEELINSALLPLNKMLALSN